MVTTLDVNAPPFYPSVQWYPVITDKYYEERPHSPGGNGFVIADACSMYHEVPDEELFDSSIHPLTTEELAELEQVDEINELLAELDIMETHQELHHKLMEAKREKRATSDLDGQIYSLIKKASKNKQTAHQHMPKKQTNCHMKKKQSYGVVQQPRTVN